MNKMKLACLLCFVVFGIGVFFTSNSLVPIVESNSGGPSIGRTGAPGETDCTACHTQNAGPGFFTITAPVNYVPGLTYQIQVDHTTPDATRLRWGFELTALDGSNLAAGTFATTSTFTQNKSGLIGGNTRLYEEHTSLGTFAGTSGGATWTFDWVAPATDVGPITFYAAGNQANNDNLKTGDQIYTTTALAGVATPTPTDTPLDTPTNTATPTDTETPVNTPTNTATVTSTTTPTNTPTNVPTATVTNTPSNTATATSTPTPVNCDTTLYGSDTSGSYFTVNINTGAASAVGTLPTGSTTEIEYDPISARAFAEGGGANTTNVIKEFNVATGAAIGGPVSHNHTFPGLEWVGSTLYGTSIDEALGASTLMTLDPLTGATTSIGATGFGPISGLAYYRSSGIMYGVSATPNSDLLTINLDTGAATTIGSTGIVAGSLEIGADGNLYAGGGQANAGNLYRINTTTGAATLVGSTGMGNISGLMRVCEIVATGTPTNTPTNTATLTPTNTATSTPTNTQTKTPTATPNDTATPGNTPSISGVVTYGNAAAPPKYISNATVTGAGSPTVMTTTAAPGGTAGQYTLTGFGAGSYTVSVSKTTGQNSITSNDAARIAQHVAGISLLTSNNQKVTADVSGNGAVSSNDAAKIAQFVAGLNPLPTPNLTGTWQFYVSPGPTFPVGASPTSRTYSSVTGNLAGEDYVGLLIGDVTGNWSNTGARSSGSVAAVPPYLRRSSASPVQASVAMPPAAEPQDPDRRPSEKHSFSANRAAEPPRSAGAEQGIGVNLPNLLNPMDTEMIIPVTIHGADDREIISYEFDLKYDPSVIQPLADPVDVSGTASRGLSFVVNANDPGLLRIVMYGPMPIDGDGVLLNLNFTPVGKSGAVSPLSFERIMFNEGEPQVTTTEGQVTLF
jgi:hypothetical protein